MAELETLEAWVGPLLQRLQPTARTQLARTVAQALRRSQQKRIAAQRNPDGSAYAPRKPRKQRGKQGRIKRRANMFQKLRTARYLKTASNASHAAVSFTERIARIARVHQVGLRDRAAPGAPLVAYNRRELLGIPEADVDMIRNIIVDQLSK